MAYAMTNPRWNANGTINVTWNHPIHGVIEFTAVNPSLPQWPDESDEMQEVWTALMRGDYGPIAGAA